MGFTRGGRNGSRQDTDFPSNCVTTIARPFLFKGFLCAAAIWALAPITAQAASPTDANPDTAGSAVEQSTTAPAVSNTPSGGKDGLEEVTVTARRREESLARTPVAVAVMGSAELAKRAITSESDLQVAVPGLLVRATENAYNLNFSIRGQSVDAFSNSLPAVLPYFNEVQVGAFASPALYDLQSVQVLKGPQGTLFGRNATGGAVLYTTTKPGNEYSGYVTGRYGNYSRGSIEGAIDLPVLADVLLVRAAGFFEHRDGFQKNLFDNSRIGDQERRGGRLTVTAKPTETLSNTLVADYFQFNGSSTTLVLYSAYAPFSTSAPLPATGLFGPTLDTVFGPGSWDRYLAAHPKSPAEGLFAFTQTQRARGPYVVDIDSPVLTKSRVWTVTNTTEQDLGSNMRLKNIFGYTDVDNPDSQAVDFDGSPYTVQGSGPTFLKTHQVSEEIQLSGNAFADALDFVSGLYYTDSTMGFKANTIVADLSPVSAPAGVIFVSRSGSTAYAGYAQTTYHLTDLTGVAGLSTVAGVRYTSEKVTSEQTPDSQLYNYPGGQNRLSNRFNKVSWQFGIDEQLNDNLLLYVTTRRSFRSGGFNVLTPPLPGNASVGGAGFDPETATDVEVGAKFEGRVADAPVRLDLALYSQTVKDLQRIIYVKTPAGFAVLTGNVPKARIQGLELDGSLRPSSWLSVGANLAYTDAQFVDNTTTIFGSTTRYGPYADTPRLSGSAFAEVNVPLGNQMELKLRSDVYSQSHFYFGSLNNTSVPETGLPGYTLVNVRVGLDKIGWSGLSIAAFAKNVFDKVYFVGGIPTGGLFSINAAIPGEPRTYGAEVQFKF